MLWLLPELLEGAEHAVTVAPATSANLTVLLLAYSFNRAVSTAHLRSLVLSLLLAWQCQGFKVQRAPWTRLDLAATAGHVVSAILT